jgi:site-specific recombinase XerD
MQFGAHRLRHGIATVLVEAGVSLALVGRWLGQSLETTTALYAHPTAEAIHRHVGPIVAASLTDPGKHRAEEAA